VKARTFLRVYRSTLNLSQDHSTLDGLPEKIRMMRLEGLFTPTTGLVYDEFDASRHCIPFIHPKEL
jgi:hypothetical protein